MTPSPSSEGQDLAALSERLRELLARATPGPWRVDGDMLVTTDPALVIREKEAIADLRYFHIPDDRENARLIVAAVNAIPELLSALSAATKRAEAAMAVVDAVVEWDSACGDALPHSIAALIRKARGLTGEGAER